MPRLFIADPMCVFDYGHNPKSVLHFEHHFKGRGFDVQSLVCREFGLRAGLYGNFRRTFGYYYQRFMPLPGLALPRTSALPSARDPMEKAALADWRTALREVEIRSDDFIFYPSVDFYGCVGLLRALASGPVAPKVHLRFIDVMEHAAEIDQTPLKTIADLLTRLRSTNAIELSAERPRYAARLANLFGQEVSVTPFPMPMSPIPLPDNRPFIVYAPGAGRMEKGFDRMLPLAERFAARHPDCDVLFRLQRLTPGHEAQNLVLTRKLYALPNIELLESALTDAEMYEQYQTSSALIMPYHTESYWERGSAALVEGVAYGRPLAISANTGVHDLVEQLPSARNCTDEDAFCAAIIYYYTLDRSTANAQILASAQRYADVARDAMRGVFRGVGPQIPGA